MGYSSHNMDGQVCVCVCVCVCGICELVAQSCPTLRPHGLQLARLLCPWDSPGKNTGVGCHALLQGFGTKSDFCVVNNKKNWSKCLKYWKIGSVAQSQETNDVSSTIAWIFCVEGLVGLQFREPAPSTQPAEHCSLTTCRGKKAEHL